MKDFSELLFLPLDIPNPPDVVNKLDTISFDDMIPDEYRSCHHIPLMDADGNWLPLSEKVPELVDWCEKYLFTWAKKSRMMVITTLSGKHNAPHIDCAPDKFETWQHKFRYVLRGDVDSLYFISKDGNVKAPQIDKPFMMCGKWPHAMNNTYPETKFTLALGAPWEPEDDDQDYINMLAKSYETYKDYYISNRDMELIDNYEELFEKKYYV